MPNERETFACYRGDQVLNGSVQSVHETSYDYYYRAEVYREPGFSAGPYMHEPLRTFGNFYNFYNFVISKKSFSKFPTLKILFLEVRSEVQEDYLTSELRKQYPYQSNGYEEAHILVSDSNSCQIQIFSQFI